MLFKGFYVNIYLVSKVSKETTKRLTTLGNESPSQLYNLLEDRLDVADEIRAAHVHSATSVETAKRSQLSEGEVLGGLALLRMFGAHRLRTARINIELRNHRTANRTLTEV